MNRSGPKPRPPEQQTQRLCATVLRSLAGDVDTMRGVLSRSAFVIAAIAFYLRWQRGEIVVVDVGPEIALDEGRLP